MDSKIIMEEFVENQDRKFGSQLMYYPCIVVLDGEESPALFTANQIKEAKTRAQKNPEDVPGDASFWDRLFG